MISCSCGYRGPYTGTTCPSCARPLAFTEEERCTYLSALTAEVRRKDPARYAEACHILFDAAHPVGIRALGELHEAEGDADRAAAVYRVGAARDALCALRYARLIERTDPHRARLFLSLSAHSGCRESFVPMAEALEREGRSSEALSFYRLAADGGERTALPSVVRLYLASGTGAAPYAAAYLARMRLPRLSAPRLSGRLRGVRPSTPPPVYIATDAELYRLCAEAERLGEADVRFALTGRLAQLGHADMQTTLARMLIAGDGCEADVARGTQLLHELCGRGDTAAALRLGDLYQKGAPLTQDYARAMTYYQRAAEFGDPKGYERMADFYRSGIGGEVQIAKAIDLYEQAIALGGTDAARKVRDLKAQREAFYERAMSERTSSPRDAYRHFVAAADMGYGPAEVRIGDCYLSGIGVRQDRRRAFLWYTHAAEAGIEEALFPLGMCYSHGVGTARDTAKALTLLKRAHAAGYEGAGKEFMRLLAAKKKKKERALHATVCELLHQGKAREALPLAALSASFGGGKELYTYGVMLEFGMGTEIDLTAAGRLYAEAAAAGFTDERIAYKRSMLRRYNGGS